MARDVDLLPWILGGCFAIGTAAVTAVALSAPQGPPAASAAPAPVSPPPALGTPIAARATSASADISPIVMSSNARQRLPPGQVWQCEVNGQRVFSDVQCDTHATVRQLSEPNVMDSSTAPRSSPSRNPYGSAYPPGAAAAPPSYYAPPMDEAAADYSGDVYAGEQYVVVRDRNHRLHGPRLYPHPHPRPHK
jgi:hypothetical protein